MTDCVITGRPHPSDDGMLVCAHHAQQLSTMLRSIEDETALLDPRKSTGGQGGTRPSGLASEQSPVQLDALVLTDSRRNAGGLTREEHDPVGLDDTPEALNVLASWAGLVRAERHLSVPTRDVVLQRWTGTVTGPRCWHPPLAACRHVSCALVGTGLEFGVIDTVVEPAYLARERGLLSRQLPWIVEQPWVDEFHADLRQLLAALRRSTGTGDERPVSVGICPTLTADGECGGRLWPDREEGSVRCSRCRRVFPHDELRHLGEILIKQGFVELFRAEWFTGVPASTLRRWVTENRLTTERNGRKLLVQIAEVEQVRDRLRRRVTVPDVDEEAL